MKLYDRKPNAQWDPYMKVWKLTRNNETYGFTDNEKAVKDWMITDYPEPGYPKWAKKGMKHK